MTVDVDSWSSLLSFYSVNHIKSAEDELMGVGKGLEKLLRIFDIHEIKATLFVPADVCSDHNTIINEARRSGHEIACHGLNHDKREFLGELETQEQKIKEATRIILEYAGVRPVGFRAPVLRIGRLTLRALAALDYVYDSSVVPTIVPGYYGFVDAPMKPYRPSFQSVDAKGRRGILELPVSVNPIVRLPLSAAWMRNLGSSWVEAGISLNFSLGNPVMFYIHPRDVVDMPKRRGVPWHVYRNTGNKAIKMLDEIIRHAEKLGAKFLTALDFAKMFDSKVRYC
jgi:peptidoglycan/xylan/chitin deacetylase (PgdA/CDA1 family)